MILAIDKIKPFSRVEAFQLIKKAKDPLISIARNGKLLERSLKKKLNDPAPTLMLASGPALKRWELVRGRCGFDSLHLKAVSSLFFGGSIDAAGLLTVTDFQAALDSVSRLDLYRRILIPGIAFNRSGLD